MTDAQESARANPLPAHLEENAPKLAAAALLERLADRIGTRASVDTVYGRPVVSEGVTVIPVARVLFALGGGGGRNRRTDRADEGLGAGGAAHARAVGFIEVRQGVATFTPIRTRRPELYGLAAVGAVLAAPKIIKALARGR